MIDCHTHRYPVEVYSNPQIFAKKQNEKHWLEIVAPSNGKSIQGWASRDQMIAAMDKASVKKAVLLSWYWENPETSILQNEWYASWLKEDSNRFYAFASIHPSLKKPLDELKKCIDLGFVGIGETHPHVQKFSMKDPVWLECVKFASENGLPINFHVTEPVGHDYPGRIPTPFEDFLWLACEFPELKIILAHAGGLFPFYELNPKVKKKLNNVFYDLSACPLLYEGSLYRKLIEVVGPEKILWGTDYPLRIFPKFQKDPDFLTFKNFVEQEAKLNDSESRAIFGENFLSLLPC